MTAEEALEILNGNKDVWRELGYESIREFNKDWDIALEMAIKALEQQPESEIKPIGYRECSNAMLKMWMDNVLTDGEYYRIMDKLNAKWSRIAESEAKKDDKGNSRENSKRDYRQNRM